MFGGFEALPKPVRHLVHGVVDISLVSETKRSWLHHWDPRVRSGSGLDLFANGAQTLDIVQHNLPGRTAIL